MINPTRIRQLPLAQMRQELLECQDCFTLPDRCAHHEDVVGGYRDGCIVIVGLNPQAALGHPVYSVIQNAPWTARRDLSDRLYEIYLDQIQPSAIYPQWAWTRKDHPGLRPKGWVDMMCSFFAIQAQELPEHVRLLETFKHATANAAALQQLPQWPQIQTNCPVWAREQLHRLAPRLIVLCGNDARELVAPHLFDLATYQQSIESKTISELHGKTFRATRTDPPTCVLFCIGLSRNTHAQWTNNPRTPRAKRVLRVAIAGGDPCAGPLEVD